MKIRDKWTLGLMALIFTFGIYNHSALAYSGKLQAPAEGNTQKITLNDGSTLYGKIISVSDSVAKFLTNMGEITIEVANIKKIEEIPESSFKGGEYWFPNPNRSRLLFGPTARSLAKGKGYFYDVWIFFPGLAFGITDNFMITGGASIIPGVDDQLFYLSPKFSFEASRKTDIAISLNVFRLMGHTLYIGLGNMTYGTDDASVTGGLGLAFTEDDVADQPVGTLGGEYRFSRRVSLVGESWFIPAEADEGMIGMGALRLFGEQMAVDFGAAVVIENHGHEEGIPDEEDESNWIPYIDFVWNF